MAGQPDPHDFVARADTGLTVQGNPFRFGGVNITWLGLRQDGNEPARRPTPFEVRDALETALAMGAAVVRVPGLLATAGCALCLASAPGHLNPGVLAQMDLVLDTARDLGIKLIVPLADSGAACGPDAAGVICNAARGPGGAAGFFAAGAVRAAFLAQAQAIVAHVNSHNAIAYRDDPTILAWEDCDGCAAAGQAGTVAAWAEQLGQAIKAADRRHLYEDGAFAGRFGPGVPQNAGAMLAAMPSVDLVGDRLAVHGDAEAMRVTLAQAAADIERTGRPYVLDAFGWSPDLFKTQADLDGWLTDMTKERELAGALTGDLQSHADGGGYLPAQPAAAPGLGSLYFPGRAAAGADLAAMQARGRALRRFSYRIAGVDQPTYLLPPQPEILHVKDGRLTWRGSAGAANYTVERSPDPSSPYTWTTLCEACVTDDAGFWQDPNHSAGQVWYRLMPLNINGHRSLPSLPAS